MDERTNRRRFLTEIAAVVPTVSSAGALAPARNSFAPAAAQRTRRPLSEGWFVKQLETDKPDVAALTREAASPGQTWLKASRMPEQVHEILLEHGLINDPYVSKNASSSAWVGEKDWAYTCKFATPSNLTGSVFLRFGGLDTLAVVYVNGREVGRFDNMYREYGVDVRRHLEPPGRDNVLLIVFPSPLKFIENYQQPPAHAKIVAKHKYLRKAFADFSSWLGTRPHSVKVGVFRDVELDVVGRAWIEDIWVRPELSDGNRAAKLRVAVEVSGGAAALDWVLTDPANSEVGRGTAAARAGANEFNIDVADPKLWWPRTHGAANLYRLRVGLAEKGELLDSRSLSVGIRDIRLVQSDPATEQKLFRFEVNGRPVMMLGGCWTPVEGMTHCWRPERAKRLLDLAEQGGINTLRMWAEGNIPPQEFYDECDRRGILIWQDFMFGYGTHPSGIPDFDSNCRAEVEGMIRSLRNHACILLWVGGNENSMALEFAGIKSDIGRELFGQIMPEACARLDPTRHFHPSSPFGGRVPNWPLEGDFHDYTAEWFSPEASVPTFTTEVGRVTAPSLRNMRRFLSEDELWPKGFDPSIRKSGQPAWPPEWAYHCSDNGWEWVAPLEQCCEPSSAADLIRAMGTAHGEYLRERLERQRRGVPDGAAAGSRRNWGNLVWCFNDSRPALHYGVIDYYLEPKITYYAMRRAYDPVLVSFERTADRIFVWVVNDSTEPVSGTLKVKRLRFDGTVQGEMQVDAQVAVSESRRCLDLTGFGPISLRNEFLLATYAGRTVSCLLMAERHLHLLSAAIQCRRAGNRIEITTDRFARQVTLEVESASGAVFEDNYFDMAPRQSRSVRIIEAADAKVVTVQALNSAVVRIAL
jgi:beta-mannosidase